MPRQSLLRLLGTGFAVAVLIGNTIGSGILRTPGDIAARLPSVTAILAIWVAGGLYALMGANIFSELGMRIPRSGGQYVFARRGLGPYPGFVVGWSDWISTCGSSAAAATVAAEALRTLFPQIPGSLGVIAIVTIIVVTIPQWISLRGGSRTQEITTAIKSIVFLALVAACFLATPFTPNAAKAVTGATTLLAVVLSLQAVIYAYDGWAGPTYFSEELTDRRAIPRSMFLGLGLVTLIYLLVNLGFLRVLGVGGMGSSTFVATDVAQRIAGSAGSTIITAVTLLTVLSAINAFQLMAPRVLYAMGKDGLVSPAFTAVTGSGTPRTSLAASTGIAIAFAASGSFNQVIAVLAFFFVANYAISFASLFAIRRNEGPPLDGWKAIGHPFTTALAICGSLAFLAGNVISDRRTAVIAIIVLAASYPVYLLQQKLRK